MINLGLVCKPIFFAIYLIIEDQQRLTPADFFFYLTYNNFTKKLNYKKYHKPPLILSLTVLQVYYCNHNRWGRSSDRTWLKPLHKTYRLSLTQKPKKPQFIKNQNCFIYRLISAIVCTMVKVHQSSIPPLWIRVTTRSKSRTNAAAATFLLSLRTFNSNKKHLLS
jgi:hypothetical protein